MPIECSIVDDVATMVAQGEFSSEDAIAFTRAFFSENPVKHVIWDFRGATLSRFAANAFRDVAEAGGEFAEARGPGAKSALVVRSQFDRMLMEAFSVVSSTSTRVRFAVFHDMESAREWLAG